jgi:hypothetical protein
MEYRYYLSTCQHIPIFRRSFAEPHHIDAAPASGGKKLCDSDSLPKASLVKISKMYNLDAAPASVGKQLSLFRLRNTVYRKT